MSITAPKTRRQERLEQRKKDARKWVATGAATLILLFGGTLTYQHLAGTPQDAASVPTIPANCSTTQTVTVATTEPMAAALKTMPVNADTCITLSLVTSKTAQDIVSESAEGAVTTNLWIPDSTVRAQLAMDEASISLAPLAESLASTPCVLASETEFTHLTWLDALKASETVSMGDPREDSAAFAALMGGVAEASAGTITLEELTLGTAARAQSVGATEAIQNANQLLTDVDKGTKKAAFVTEADYVSYTSAHPGSGLTATFPGRSSFTLDYPLYQTRSNSNNTTIDTAALHIIDFMDSEEGRAALAHVGLRPADGQNLGNEHGLGAYTALTPSNQGFLTQIWNLYSLQSAPFNALVVIDSSGSMLTPVAETGKNRMELTIESALAGSQLFPARDSIGLWKSSPKAAQPDGSSASYRELVPVRGLEETVDGKTQREILQETGISIASSVEPNSVTDLNATLLSAFKAATANYQPGAVNGVIMLTDGENFTGGTSQEDLIARIQQQQNPDRPVFIILIGVSDDAHMELLNSIAHGVGGEAHRANSPADIQRIFIEALTGISGSASAPQL
ncbi:hypothetical protein A7979_11245 [Rothia nasimurium]|uniref:VWFA domain-containing protein n=1 Tax=Rothia nasimurium TaxID=85336 RepID=A0A1Y1RR95_9MICC|nr:VWA domain-containing protein [Rothia nasimurium]ORC20237.1 hypothetical protein A7979_11245 [Rothia nasimurium]